MFAWSDSVTNSPLYMVVFMLSAWLINSHAPSRICLPVSTDLLVLTMPKTSKRVSLVHLPLSHALEFQSL